MTWRLRGRWRLVVLAAIWMPLLLALTVGASWLRRVDASSVSSERALANAVARAWARRVAVRADLVVADLDTVGTVLIGPRPTLASLPATMVPVLEAFVARQSAIEGIAVVAPHGGSIWWRAGRAVDPVAVGASGTRLVRVSNGFEIAVAIHARRSAQVDYLVEALVAPGTLQVAAPAQTGVRAVSLAIGGVRVFDRATAATMHVQVASALGPVEVEFTARTSVLDAASGPMSALVAAIVVLVGASALVTQRFVRDSERYQAELAWREALERALAELAGAAEGAQSVGAFLEAAAGILGRVPGVRVLQGRDGDGLEVVADDPRRRAWLAPFEPRIRGAIDREVAEFALVDRLRRAEAEARSIARRDPLTGLANRMALTERLVRLTSDASVGAVVCMLIDLDDFKEVNDSFGHVVGDQVLIEAARRVAGEVARRLPSALVARFGGDEFVILAALAMDEAAARDLAQRIGRALRRPVELEAGLAVTIGASVGWSWWPRDAGDLAGLLRVADATMYEAKRARSVRGAGASDARSAIVDPWGPEATAELAEDPSWRVALGGALPDEVLDALVDGPAAAARAVARWGGGAVAELADVPPSTRIAMARLETGLNVAGARRRVLRARWSEALDGLDGRPLGSVLEEVDVAGGLAGVHGAALVEVTGAGRLRVRGSAGRERAALVAALEEPSGPLARRVIGVDEQVVGDGAIVCRREDSSVWGLVVAVEVAPDATEPLLGRLVEAICDRIALLRRGYHSTLGRREILTRLRGGGVRLALQPIVRLGDASVIGLEALARLDDGRGRLWSPAEFLPFLSAAELGELFERVLDDAVGLAANCLRPDLAIGVNAPTAVLANPSSVDTIRRVLERYAVAPWRLTIEVLEDSTGAPSSLEATLVALGALGVRRALDDVGSSGQGIVRLASLSVDLVKVASDVVAALGENPLQAIVTLDAVARLGEGQGCSVVLEGIETRAQFEVARALGIELGQGYFLGRPELARADAAWVDPGVAAEAVGAAYTTLPGALAWHWRHRGGHECAVEACPITPALTGALAALHLVVHGRGDAGSPTTLTDALVAAIASEASASGSADLRGYAVVDGGR
ncbi:diguanylate cyclase/phosphodiesterase [Acidimicrobium ferrooxidans DSM 10331]|uniref:Diguanylate cyclase/phosphodiesterase n=1 Tax=Acidimicrobium ferrooxidans (strain DSM 10331 / JCM 15462 / NBRC 103882 / ICP) TaxID=525909 RepID=C7LZ76_ACIFD|nr:bifunctional diguanylate cyclase/phosphodiesterase [Acidimicrobium ferrooxidans]ACU54034.1 diguanylate cyclase/phosphodiesterase [Acidimicrobium ferrooxidans DSM 10331]